MGENNRIEYKRELTSELDIEKEIIAFLNYKEGGYIYIGIDENGVAIGVDDADGCMLKLKDRIKHNISPSAMGLFDIVEEKREGHSIIKITVASGIEKPYFKTKYGMTPRGTYLRVGTSAEPMPQDQIDRLFAMRTRNSIGRIVSNRQDLTFEQLRIYYDEHGKRLNDNFKRTLELLTEDGKHNYVAYLLADENGNSIKVAKYSSLDRCDLVENNEYGYCSLIKATKSVLAKLDIENKVAATITPMERIETPLWNKVALREAVINAIVHNDYSFEVPPKFEIFPDRLEITSAGRLPESLSREEFFNGISIPRNKELMRIYRDVELVESLGSGIPRILHAYGEECFMFTDNFIRITFPANVCVNNHDGTKSAPSRHQVGTKLFPDIENIDKLIVFCIEKRSVTEMLSFMNFSDRTKFRKKFIYPLLEAGILQMTHPEKPNSNAQRYFLTPYGLNIIGEK
ncbi:MAG: putative DNA binding domain-containing protein [Prevotella sp.]|nr:putative DNA binding domain-containing protein [Prevotella sp.]